MAGPGITGRGTGDIVRRLQLSAEFPTLQTYHSEDERRPTHAEKAQAEKYLLQQVSIFSHRSHFHKWTNRGCSDRGAEIENSKICFRSFTAHGGVKNRGEHAEQWNLVQSVKARAL